MKIVCGEQCVQCPGHPNCNPKINVEACRRVFSYCFQSWLDGVQWSMMFVKISQSTHQYSLWRRLPWPRRRLIFWCRVIVGYEGIGKTLTAPSTVIVSLGIWAWGGACPRARLRITSHSSNTVPTNEERSAFITYIRKAIASTADAHSEKHCEA